MGAGQLPPETPEAQLKVTVAGTTLSQPAALGVGETTAVIVGAAASIRDQHAMLSDLDCATGDGDHGTTMLRVVDRLERAFAPGGPEDLKTCLQEAGWSVMGVDGGASSSLLGIFLAPWRMRSGSAAQLTRATWRRCSRRGSQDFASRPRRSLAIRQ